MSPVLSINNEVGKITWLEGKTLGGLLTPVAETFQIVNAFKSPTSVGTGIAALSGLIVAGVSPGGVIAEAGTKGVDPAIQISPTASTAAAVATDP